MALETNELFSERSFIGRPRMVVERNRVGTFAVDASARELTPGCPIAYNGTNWVPLAQGADAAVYTITSDGATVATAATPQVDVITADGTPASAGTFRLIINGHSETFAFDPTGAEMQTQLRAMLAAEYGANAVACVSSVDVDLGDANSVITLTFVASMGLVDIEIEQLNITAGNDHVLSQTTPGVNAIAGSAGLFSLTVEGLLANIAFDATAAQIQAELRAVLGTPSVTAVATTGANLGVDAAVVTLTFDENFGSGAPSVEMDTSQMTGPVHVLAASDAGTEMSEADKIRGFIAHANVQLSATDEVQGDVMLEGEVHRDDINTAAIRALCTGSISEAELDVKLKAQKLRDLSLHVRGLAGVN